MNLKSMLFFVFFGMVFCEKRMCLETQNAAVFGDEPHVKQC